MDDGREIKSLLLNHINQSREDQGKLFDRIGEVKEELSAMNVHAEYSKEAIQELKDVLVEQKKKIEDLEKEHNQQKGMRRAAAIGFPIGITLFIEGCKKYFNL